jgi:hypothetical protein
MLNNQKNLKSGFSIFKTLIVIIIIYFAWNYYEENYLYKNTPKYVVEFKNAIKEFTGQKDTVKKAYKEAIEAQEEAKKVNYVFKNEKTKTFISKWKEAEKEVDTLREKYSTYKNETENFLDGLDDKLDQIKNDKILKTKMKKFSKERAIKMASNIVKMDKNLDKLEISITKGNNLIIALETVSSFNELAQDIKDFDILLDSSSEIFTEIDSLIIEGTSVLDKELKE